MTREEISQHAHWEGEGRICTIRFFVKVKTPVSNVFIDGIAYENCTGIDREIYVRSLVDFLEKFKPYSILDEA